MRTFTRDEAMAWMDSTFCTKPGIPMLEGLADDIVKLVNWKIKAERAAVVAWLRAQSEMGYSRLFKEAFANAIECGDHLEEQDERVDREG